MDAEIEELSTCDQCGELKLCIFMYDLWFGEGLTDDNGLSYWCDDCVHERCMDV
jgi:hypothetical protein